MLIQEIEEKAPVLKKQKQDYEKCLESVTHLTHQLDSAMVVSTLKIQRYTDCGLYYPLNSINNTIIYKVP